MKKKVVSSCNLLRDVVKRFAGLRILVIGDVMVDRYFSVSANSACSFFPN